MRYRFPYRTGTGDYDNTVISFPDVPEAITSADTALEKKNIRYMAHVALITALSYYVVSNKRIPMPSSAEGRDTILLSISEVVKLTLHEAMIENNVSDAEIAAKLGVKLEEIIHLRNPASSRYRTSDAVETALKSLGYEIDVEISLL